MAVVRFSEIDTTTYTSNAAVGGNSGDSFYCNVVENGGLASMVIIRSFKFWYDPGQNVRGVRVELTDGRKQDFGEMTGTETETFYIVSGERITSLKIWWSGWGGGRLNGLEMKTNLNRTFDFGSRDFGPYEPEIGSGIPIGIFGKSSNDINCFGIAILRRVEKVRIKNVDYPDLDTIPIALGPKAIRTIKYDNSEGETEQTFTFSGSASVITASSWSVTAGLEVGIETEIEAGVPMIASVKAKVSVKMSISYTRSSSTTTTSEESFSFPITIPKGEIVQATATFYEGIINTPYSARIVYTLDSNVEYGFDVKGVYNGVDSDKVEVVLEKYN